MANAWNLGDIMSKATQALGNRTDIVLADASFYANEAARIVYDAIPHEGQEAIAISSTTSGEDKITLPADFQEILTLSNLSDGGGSPDVLDPINEVELASYSTDTGTPLHYAQFANWLELRPSPDSSYSLELRYRKQQSTMTETTTVPSVATRFRYAVFLKTKQLLAENVVRDEVEAQRANADYLDFLGQVPSDRALRYREQRYLGISLPTSTLKP
jgi:hypothetical protein